MNAEILVGQWVSRKEQLAFLSEGSGAEIRGYLSGDDRSRIQAGAKAIFVPDDLTGKAITATISQVGVSSVSQLDLDQLTSQFGGKVATHPTTNGKLVPVSASYAVTAKVDSFIKSHRQVRDCCS